MQSTRGDLMRRVLEHPDVVRAPDARGEAKAWCPWHPDREGGKPSLTINVDKGIVKCFVCGGGGLRELEEAWGLQGGGGGVSTPRSTPAHLHTSAGLRLAKYAKAKKLPVEGLKRAGLSDITYMGLPAIRIPYPTLDGSEGPVRIRKALQKGEGDDERFAWTRGSKPIPYGLSRKVLDKARETGELDVGEGESDAHTAWHHEIPFIGIPGASSFATLDRYSDALAGISRFNVLIEPDQGGQTVLAQIEKSVLRDRVWTFTIPGFKDVSELHLKSETPEGFLEAYRAAKRAGVKWTERAAQERAERAVEAWAACEELSRSGRILDRFYEALRERGVVGEEVLTRLIYLAMTSRLFQRPVSVAIKGPSAAGKSYAVEQVLTFFPPSEYHALTGMSERALVYDEAPLSHRMLVVLEAPGLNSNFGSYVIRSLLSEGRIKYTTVEKTSEGLRSRTIEREGPTGLITTTTAIKLHAENETRLLSLTVNDTREQTASVLESQGRAAEGALGASLDLGSWHALQTALTLSPAGVVVPFGSRVATKIRPLAVRLRRDFPTVLSLVEAHALLHQRTRARDEAGRIVADRCDYEVVRDLVADFVAEGVEATVPKSVSEAVQRVRGLCEKDKERVVTIRELAAMLNLDRSTVTRRVANAIDRGYLRNLEERKGRPARLSPGDPLPDQIEILPAADALGLVCTCAGVSGGDKTPPSPLPSQAEAVNDPDPDQVMARVRAALDKEYGPDGAG